MRVRLWATMAIAMVGCETEPPECEVLGIQTCRSELRIRFRDDQPGPFTLVVQDDVGMDLTINCPDETKGPDEQDGYMWICGGSEVLITHESSYFANEVRIGVGGLPPTTREVQNTPGQDACGNRCTTGSVEI